MLRADMHALPVREETGLSYASVETAADTAGKRVPVMHAFGHDMHVTWLIGAATVLAQTRDTWKGTLMPVFHPAEESDLCTRADAQQNHQRTSDQSVPATTKYFAMCP
jgi:hippurate hydrolase